MKLKLLIGISLIVILAGSIWSISAQSTDKPYDSLKLNSDITITIDGKADDWGDVTPVKTIQKPARNDDNASYNAEFYSVHDDTYIYFLVIFKNDAYAFYDPATCDTATGCEHDYAPAIALAWPIDDGAKPEFMGGQGRPEEEADTLSGQVDIMHWELDTLNGVTAGGAVGSGTGDGKGNLDDEFAFTMEDRHDDNETNSENSYLGAWTHTGDYKNGTMGDWIFEIKRKLTTGDPRDVQFEAGKSYRTAIAFWSPNEHTSKKWTDSGHFVNYDNVIDMTISANDLTTASSTSDSPGFGLALALFSSIATAIILKKKR